MGETKMHKEYKNLIVGYIGHLKDKQGNVNLVYLDKDSGCYVIREVKPYYRNTTNNELKQIKAKFGKLEIITNNKSEENK